jgi:hypothetical protein
MADFSTICDPNNKTLNLYCNSINTNQQAVKSYLYANLVENTILTDTNISPMLIHPTLSNNISIVDNIKIKFNNNGLYAFNLSILGINSAYDTDPTTTPSPELSIYLAHYDAQNNIISSSQKSIAVIDPTTVNVNNPTKIQTHPVNLPVNSIFNINTDEYVVCLCAVLRPTSDITNFTCLITQINLSVTVV